MVCAVGFAGTGYAETLTGRCSVQASAHGGKKYAILKCDKSNRPGDYIIRSTVWEKADKAGYAKLARFAGRRFTCNLVRGNSVRGVGVETRYYSLANCK